MQVDFVRVYQRPGSATQQCASEGVHPVLICGLKQGSECHSLGLNIASWRIRVLRVPSGYGTGYA